MSGRHEQYYNPYFQHGHQEYLLPPAPIAHPLTHHSSLYAAHLPHHIYDSPRGHPYATPRSGGDTFSVQEIAAEDVKFSIEGNKKRKKEVVEVNDGGQEDQRDDSGSNNHIDDPLYIRQQIMGMRAKDSPEHTRKVAKLTQRSWNR